MAAAREGDGDIGLTDQQGVGALHEILVLGHVGEILAVPLAVVGGEGEGQHGGVRQAQGGGGGIGKAHLAGMATVHVGGLQAQGVAADGYQIGLQRLDGLFTQVCAEGDALQLALLGEADQGAAVLQVQTAVGQGILGYGDAHMKTPFGVDSFEGIVAYFPLLVNGAGAKSGIFPLFLWVFPRSDRDNLDKARPMWYNIPEKHRLTEDIQT